MTTPLTTNQADPRERTDLDPFNRVETQEAGNEEMNDEGIDLEDQEVTDDEVVDDDDNA